MALQQPYILTDFKRGGYLFLYVRYAITALFMNRFDKIFFVLAR